MEAIYRNVMCNSKGKSCRRAKIRYTQNVAVLHRKCAGKNGGLALACFHAADRRRK